METLLIALGAFVAYIIAYRTYGRWLGEKVFRLNADAVCPSVEVNDGRDFVPTRRSIIFGHHFTSIAGTGPIVGPAIAVFWGWLPALIWVLVGSIFIGAVHDFGALVVSLRSRGQTIGEVAGRMINPRARILFLVVLFLALMVVIGIFGLVIAVIFATYPVSVLAVWIEIPIAVAVGFWVYKRGGNLLIPSLIALGLMYFAVWLGAYHFPIDLTKLGLGLAANGAAAAAAGQSPFANAIVVWTVLLLVYCFIASVLPVWTLLQPRDFINSHQLLLALAVLFLGLLLTPLIGGGMEFVAPAINTNPPPDAPPIWPFLFITIACGAVSGFHCLVSSGTTSKQLKCETDARAIGYGSMLLEGGLAVIVILACTAGLGKGVYSFDADAHRYVPVLAEGSPVVGAAAWDKYYGGGTWASMKLPQKIGGFIEGGANMIATVGIPITLGIAVMAVLVASFAATTLDTATRLQRYVITELAGAVRLPLLQGRYVATAIAVGSGGFIALFAGKSPGSGGLILWPIFGATNQLLAGLSFLVIVFYLKRHNRPVWFAVPPTILMLIMPAWAMVHQLQSWWAAQDWLLLSIGVIVEIVQVWMVIEAALLWSKVRGVKPDPLPPLLHAVPATAGGPSTPGRGAC
ncbi:MAG: carbon starvation protein A [Planctomycetes bacterium]|nr:carbon starvation protein A [Planctomycetota bacterium]